MNDGSYEIGVSLEGGSGKASVSSPMRLEVENGEITPDQSYQDSGNTSVDMKSFTVGDCLHDDFY